MAYNYRSRKELTEGFIPRLYKEIYIPIGDIDMTVYVTPEPVPFAEKTSGEKKIVRKGDVWGEPWDCGWFNFTGNVPECAKGKKVVLYIDVNGEFGIYNENGVMTQGLTSGSALENTSELGFSYFIIRKREYIVSECAKGGEEFNIWADAGCNFVDGTDIPTRPDVGKITYADICIMRDNVKALFYDYFTLFDLLKTLPENSARYSNVEQALYEVACMMVDFSDEEVEKAIEILKVQLDKKGGDPDLEITGIGHSHIDLAWLWPIRETRRKGLRTFANTLYYMDKHPEYMFGASQPQLFEWVKEDQPEIYEKVKEKVKEGRWEIQGAMWVEPDANVTGGESFVRQILYGKRFFRDEFGEDMRLLWLPDVFGYSAALPQILKKSGVPYFLTNKICWGNRHNKFPHHTYKWKGLDGTEVLAHMPPEGKYDSYAMPTSIKKLEDEYMDKRVSNEALLLFGFGDGGGGAGDIQFESLKRLKNMSGLQPVKQGKVIDFFDRIVKNWDKYATYEGELYFEMHQGTYTTQGRNKWYNRKMEKLLREAEFASAVKGADYPGAEFERIWKEVLLYQFHDILPGSSIKRVYDESLERYAILYDETTALIKKAYGDGEYAINSLSWDRCGWEKIDGRWYNINVPALGSVMLDGGIESKEIATENNKLLENDCIKVSFDDEGAITSVYDKKNCREALSDKSNRFAVYFDDGNAWDFSESYRDFTPKYFKLTKTEAFTDGPVSGIRMEYEFSKSKLWQTVSVKDGCPFVEFDTRVDWKECNRMLRTAFNTTVNSTEVCCDIQYGYIKRPTHSNTSWDMAKFEICAHKYADISDNGYGVALMNDSKYGYYAKDGVLDLNLLRSSMTPGIDADVAEHTFKYALYPHSGNVVSSDVIQKSYEFNQPLYKGGEIEQLFTLSNKDIIVESVKKAEDSDAVIIRMYESKGGEAETSITFNKPVKAVHIVDLMEENEEETDLNAIKFHKFEIITIKVEI